MEQTNNQQEPPKENKYKAFVSDMFYLRVLAIIFAFAGWIIENIGMLIFYGVIDSRYRLLPFVAVVGALPYVFYGFGSPDDLHLFKLRFFKEKRPSFGQT